MPQDDQQRAPQQVCDSVVSWEKWLKTWKPDTFLWHSLENRRKTESPCICERRHRSDASWRNSREQKTARGWCRPSWSYLHQTRTWPLDVRISHRFYEIHCTDTYQDITGNRDRQCMTFRAKSLKDLLTYTLSHDSRKWKDPMRTWTRRLKICKRKQWWVSDVHHNPMFSVTSCRSSYKDTWLWCKDLLDLYKAVFYQNLPPQAPELFLSIVIPKTNIAALDASGIGDKTYTYPGVATG